MNKIKIALILFSCTLAALAKDDSVDKTIKKTIESLNPDIPVTSISPSPVDGIMEVQLENNDYIYVTEDTQYIFSGRLLKTEADGKGVADITALKKREARKSRIQSLDLSKSITFPGNSEKNDGVIVFTDTTCPYCKKFHKNIEAINNNGITVHYFAFPRKGVDSRSARILDVVWCTSDPRKALTLAKEGKIDKISEKAGDRIKQCSSPVAEQYQLGQDLGVTGTPGVYTMDGEHLGGYVSPEKLNEAL